jgi:hypothetical protein
MPQRDNDSNGYESKQSNIPNINMNMDDRSQSQVTGEFTGYIN